MDVFMITILVGVISLVLWKILTSLLKYKELCDKLRKIPQKPSHWLKGHGNEVKDSIAYNNYVMDVIKGGGRVYCIWNGLFPVLGVCHPKTFQQLNKQVPNKARGLTDWYRIMEPWIGEGLIINGGKKWERNRRLLTPMFHSNILSSYVDLMSDVTDVFLELESILSEHFGRTPVNSQEELNDETPVVEPEEPELLIATRVRDYLVQRDTTDVAEDNESEQDVNETGDARDEDFGNVRRFLSDGCGCRHECHKQFDYETVVNHVLDIRALTKDEKELNVMSLLMDSNGDTTKRGKRRKRSRSEFKVEGSVVCKKTFMLFFDTGKHQLLSLQQHVREHGLTPRVHGNRGRKPRHAISYDDVMCLVHFIRNYADERGLPQPAAPRGVDNVPTVYLTSDTTKANLHKQYQISCTETGSRVLQITACKEIWRTCLPHIRIAGPRDDVCATCEKLRRSVMDAVTEEEKLTATDSLRSHILLAQKDKLDKHSRESISVDTFPYSCRSTLDSMLRCLLSYDGSMLESDEHEYIKAVQRLTTISWERMLQPLLLFDFLFNLSPLGREHNRLIAVVHKFTGDIIETRRHILKEQPDLTKQERRVDFLDILLTAKDENGHGLSRQEVQDEVDNIAFAGHDTSGSTISWAIYALGQNPGIQEKVYKDVQSVTKGVTDITQNHLPQFKYLPLFIKEVLRFYSVVPVVARKHSEPITIDGIEIPPGPRVDINIYAIHHNPQVWKDPEEFNPDRFDIEQRSETDVYGFIPFSAGSRNCIGQVFAMNEIKVTLAKVVNRFEVLPVKDHKPQFLPSSVMRSLNGLPVKLVRRQ